MVEIKAHYVALLASIIFFFLGIGMATYLSPSPAQPLWYYYLPPTLPGLLNALGTLFLVIGVVAWWRTGLSNRAVRTR